MRQSAYVLICSILVLSLTGCNAANNAGEGAVVGGGLGALAGGIIGHQSHSDAAGILIGGALGAAGGAVVGSQVPKEQVYEPPQPTGPAMPINQITMQQIVDWSAQGLPSDEIISRIRTTHSNYALTSEDINYLRRNGVSQRVIEAMQQAG